MRKSLFVLVVVFFAAVFAGTGSSYATDGPDRHERESIREKVKILYVWELTKALDLDEETASILLPTLHRYEQTRKEIQQSIREDRRALEEALEENSHRRMRRILDRLEEKHEALQELNEAQREELRDILTVKQQAKFVLFHHEFKKEMKKIMEKEKKHRFGMNR